MIIPLVFFFASVGEVHVSVQSVKGEHSYPPSFPLVGLKNATLPEELDCEEADDSFELYDVLGKPVDFTAC